MRRRWWRGEAADRGSPASFGSPADREAGRKTYRAAVRAVAADDRTPRGRVLAVVAAVLDGGRDRPEELRGLSGETLREVERDQAAPVAEAYREFLTVLGGGAGRLMVGSDVYHPHVLGLGTDARLLLAENGSPFVLEGTDRVFFMHQGYEFAFMRGAGPDPEVWTHVEGGDGERPVRTHPSFTAWLRSAADREVRAWARPRPRPPGG